MTPGRPASRYVPVAYLAAALVLVVALLPTALRPPQQPPNASAEFSPDAPPDDTQDAIVSSLQRGTSSAAGAGEAADASDLAASAARHAPDDVAAPPPARACGHGFGDPPRQAESVYAPTCAPAWSGDNGGATWKGVTADTVRVGVRGTGSRGGANDCGENGRLDSMDPDSMNAGTRTFYVLQQYFNATFQLYGRRLEFYCVAPASRDTAGMHASAVEADEEYGIFGSPYQSSGDVACKELARRQILSFCDELPASDYLEHAPYLWGGDYPSATGIADAAVEFWCTALAGRPAVFAGDPLYQRTERKFAVVIVSGRGHEPEELHTLGRDECGLDVEVLLIPSAEEDAGTVASASAAAITRLKADGVTTVMPWVNWITAAQLTNAASAQGYFPEWYVNDFGALGRNQIGNLQNQSQWAHAFGVTAMEPERPLATSECYRAYRTIDPAGTPSFGVCTYMWRNFVLFASGIQLAGPKLTPTTFRDGLFSLGMRYYRSPSWAVGGGFAPGDYTYPKDVALLWWNPAADDPTDQGSGAYTYLHDARRFCLGDLPADTSPFFREGISRPVDYDRYTVSAPSPTCLP